MKKKSKGNLILSYLLIIVIGCVLVFPHRVDVLRRVQNQ